MRLSLNLVTAEVESCRGRQHACRHLMRTQTVVHEKWENKAPSTVRAILVKSCRLQGYRLPCPMRYNYSTLRDSASALPAHVQ